MSFKFRTQGFTLVEALIDFAILSAVIVAVFGAYSASFKSIDLAKAKIASVALANEKMEEIRNMPYDGLATENGLIYPPGSLKDDQQENRKGTIFNVNTVIACVDDPFDGLGASDLSQNICDYKRVEITVSKVGRRSYLTRLSSFVAAKAAETPSATGIIKFCVIDANSNPVVDARITITNPETDPPVNVSGVTGNDGCVMMPNLPPDSHNHYHLVATKDGFSTDMTYPRTAQNPNALHPDINVLIQQVTAQTLVIDRLGKMTVTVKDETGNLAVNTAVHIEGSKEIYFNPSTPKYLQDFTTDANGQVIIEKLEFDGYTISVPGWTIFTTSPYQPIQFAPAADLAVEIGITHSATLPIVTGVEPLRGKRDEVTSVTIRGRNFADNPVVELVNPDGSKIAGLNVVVSRHAGDEFIDADFDLNGAAVGTKDILITNPNNEAVIQRSGFEVIE